MRAAHVLAALLAASPALANHPGDRLDEATAEKEPAFEPTDQRGLPEADLRTPAGDALTLADLANRIVVLSFMPDACGELCEAQQALLTEVLEGVNITPMRDMVTFVTVAAAGAARETPATPNALTVTPAEGSVAALSERFAAFSERDDAGPRAHVIDRRGRHAGIFHGADFGPVNMVLYINGLSNAPPPDPGVWERVRGVLR